MSGLSLLELQQIPNIEFLANQVVEGFITGLHKSPYHGFSVEFAEHRQYNTGDNSRHIDWKLYARTDKLFIKKYEEETNLRCQLVIDTSGSMYYPTSNFNKIKFSAVAAAALVQLLKKQRDASGLTLINEQIELHTSAKSNAVHCKNLLISLQKCIDEHKKTTNTKQSQIAKNIDLLAEQLHKRSLVVIFSDFMEADLEALKLALQHLKFNKHEVILFHVGDDETEAEFNFSKKPHIFIDSETGEEVKLNPANIREAYVEKMKQHKSILKTICMQFKIDYVEAFVNQNFEQVLFPFLKKRAKLI
jgi:uncharacterized protein (DUF58 family)